jgi:hypothetical protein
VEHLHNIKMDFKGIDSGDVYWSGLPPVRDQCHGLVDKVMNFQAP